MTDNELVNLLPTRRGHFRFESGYHGEWWLELDQLFTMPDKLRPFAESLSRQLARYDVEAVCGPLAGGAFLAQMIAEALDAEFYFTTRIITGNDASDQSVIYELAHGLHPLVRSKRVAVVDDAINAGSAIRATFAALRAARAFPVVVGALVLLGDTATDWLATEGVPLEYLAKLANQLWRPADCPLCAAGVPLIDGESE